MIARGQVEEHLRKALKRARVVALVGPRQCGKTSLARRFVPSSAANYFDLEDPTTLSRLSEPMTTLAKLRGLVVIDEIQRRPELFPVLRVLADRQGLPARFLALGSASPHLLRQASESLAGRIEVVELGGFQLSDVGPASAVRLWRRGGLPRSYLARSEADSLSWRRSFVQAFIERDLPQMGVSIGAPAILRFWTMLAHYHGQVWNAADPARSLGVNESTVRRYLDLLDGVFMVRQLRPWFANLGKRQVKAPKIYIRDTGLLHGLLGIRTEQDLMSHPKCGASWEGYVVQETLQAVQPEEAYFWATHNGAELDLLLLKDGQRLGVECKFGDAPRLTPSMRTAMHDLDLAHLTVFYPGDRTYDLAEHIRVVPLTALTAGNPVRLLAGKA